MKTMKPAFDKAYWKNGFYSTKPESLKDDRANAIAIVSGIAKPEYYNQIVDNVLIPNRFSSPHFEWIAEEAMCMAGRSKESLERMKDQYQSQVDKKDMTTLYEMFPNGGSYNHAWNAPNYVLSRYIAGISATDVAWKTYQVLPDLAHMTAVKQVVPSVQGDITVDIQKTDTSYRMQLISPAGTTAVVGIPKASITPKTIEINGSIFWKDGEFVGKLDGITWNGEDEKYIKFNVSPGTWAIAGKTH